MASFSFGSGNAAKLLSIPLYAVGRLATLIIPRSRDEWIVGCGAGIGDGALEVFELARERGRWPIVWAVTTAQQERVAASNEAEGSPADSRRLLRRCDVLERVGDLVRIALVAGAVGEVIE